MDPCIKEGVDPKMEDGGSIGQNHVTEQYSNVSAHCGTRGAHETKKLQKKRLYSSASTNYHMSISIYKHLYISLYIYIYIYMKIDKDVEVEQARDPRKMIEHILRCLETRRVLIG
jgi:NAD+--asparagine ADP-ribosyltransferase